jgi:hypothetical protein
MMAMDATRLPRGAKYEVRPGKNMLVNGNPNEIMMPFKFGTTDPANFQTAQNFQGMLQQATGTLDSSAMPGQVAGGEASGAGLSMALSGLMKKNKRTLINFQEDFLVPFITKAAWRFMQFDPERYPVKDYVFLPVSTMGMVAREYEQQQMVGLMQTLGPNSPITPVLLQGIIASSSMSNRDEVIATLKQMSEPNPEQAQVQQVTQQLQIQTLQAQLQKIQAEAALAQANAQQAGVETQLMPVELQIKAAEAQSKSNGPDAFTRAEKIAGLNLKQADIVSNERIAQMQMANKQFEKQAKLLKM